MSGYRSRKNDALDEVGRELKREKNVLQGMKEAVLKEIGLLKVRLQVVLFVFFESFFFFYIEWTYRDIWRGKVSNQLLYLQLPCLPYNFSTTELEWSQMKMGKV